MKKERIDVLLTERGLAESRERAKALIMSGIVFVNNIRTDKAGTAVPYDAVIEVRGSGLPFVSRGGFKLDKAIKVFNIDPSGMTCLDCGASTGGFTDVLLQNGAAKVYSIDVGYGQLAWKLRNDPRVVNLERVNIRYLTKELVPEQADLAVMDVSFISIKLILPVLKDFLKENHCLMCLIKPQFEAGREEVGKHGVVKDPLVHADVCRKVISFAMETGYSLIGLDYSPVKGPEGNIEFLCYLKNSAGESKDIDIDSVVEAAHKNL